MWKRTKRDVVSSLDKLEKFINHIVNICWRRVRGSFVLASLLFSLYRLSLAVFSTIRLRFHPRVSFFFFLPSPSPPPWKNQRFSQRKVYARNDRCERELHTIGSSRILWEIIVFDAILFFFFIFCSKMVLSNTENNILVRVERH